MKKYAFLLMGSQFAPEEHNAHFETEQQVSSIFTVKSLEEAGTLLLRLAAEGYGAVELCGAFGEEAARKLIALTHNRIAVGYSVHLPEQNVLFDEFFSDEKACY